MRSLVAIESGCWEMCGKVGRREGRHGTNSGTVYLNPCRAGVTNTDFFIKTTNTYLPTCQRSVPQPWLGCSPEVPSSPSLESEPACLLGEMSSTTVKLALSGSDMFPLPPSNEPEKIPLPVTARTFLPWRSVYQPRVSEPL